MKKVKNLSIFLLTILSPLFLSSCRNLDRLSVSGQFEKLTYGIGEEFVIGDSFKVYANNKEINDYEIYLDNFLQIYEGYKFYEQGEFNVIIREEGYYDYVLEDKIIVSTLTNELRVDVEQFGEVTVGSYLDLQYLYVYDALTNERVFGFTIYHEGERVTEFLFDELKTYYFTIRLDGYKDANISITVTMGSLSIINEPIKTTYEVGESLDLTGLMVGDGSAEINGYKTSLPEGYIFKHKGEITITVTKDYFKETSFKVIVMDKVSLRISNNAQKLYFEQGEPFTSEGLEIKDVTSGFTVEDYSLSIDEGAILNTIGKQEVIISKNGYDDISYTIEVIEPLEIGDRKEFTIYSINDTHGSFIRNEENGEAGISYLGQYFLKNKSENTLLLCGGDMWQGGLESNYTKGLIMTQAMNIMGVEAMTIGNHEFDWGLSAIQDNLDIMEFPLLACNILNSYNHEPVNFTVPSVIIDKANVKIGVIGSIMEGIGEDILPSIAKDFIFDNPIEYIKDESDKLRREGCDLIILLSHDGGFEGYNGSPTKFEDLTYESEISGERYVDAMFFAHDHLRKSGTYNGVPYLEGGCNGEYFTQMNFEVQRIGEDDYEFNFVDNYVLDAISYCDEDNAEINNLLDIYQDVIPNGDEMIYNFKNYYSRDEFTSIVCDALLWFARNRLDFYYLIDASVHNYGGIRDSVSSGPFTFRDLIKVCPFTNSICILECDLDQYNYLTNNDSLCSEKTYSTSSNTTFYVITISYVAEQTFNGDKPVADYIYYYNDYVTSDVLSDYLLHSGTINL